MFPLGTVLFPTLILPLHVFEPRYRALVENCLAAPQPEFGVVLIERGSEVGGDDVRFGEAGGGVVQGGRVIGVAGDRPQQIEVLPLNGFDHGPAGGDVRGSRDIWP